MLFALILGFLGAPTPARAGVFSFMDTALGATVDAEEVVYTRNSQTMPLLQAVAHLDPNPGKGGPDMTIVEDSALESSTGPEGTVHEIEDKVSSDKISVYVVREGDTLSGIAQMFGVSVNTVMWANNITSAKGIHKDQTLVILPISGVKYVVKKGDSLKSIASKYKADVDEIIAFNDLSSNTSLVAGTEIIIPNAEPVSAPASKVIAKTGTKGASAYVDTTGYFMRPIKAGRRSQGIHGRNGVDLADKIGTPIYAAAAGTVLVSKTGGWNGGYGNYIVIAHGNGTQTLYAHNSQNFVVPGQTVEKGENIALMGSTGNSTGSHVHFEIRGGGRNPF